MLETGSILQDRYKVRGVIGEGGMATVYLAEDRVNPRQVAIKEMRPDTELSQTLALQQFEQEARLLADLDHPNIPHVYDFFGESGHQYLVMDYLEGQTLEHRIVSFEDNRENAPAVREVLDWGVQVAGALEYLHAQKPKPIIYKDLKPDNLMLTVEGKVMLLDFGIAKGRDMQGKYYTILKGMVSPGYASPEQYAGAATDPRADVYSLGATVYALLAGNVPPDAIKRQELLVRGGLDPLPQLSVVNHDVSPQLDGVVRKMMALKKAERYQTATECVTVLRTELFAIDNRGKTATPVAAPLPRPSFWIELRHGFAWLLGGWRRR